MMPVTPLDQVNEFNQKYQIGTPVKFRLGFDKDCLTSHTTSIAFVRTGIASVYVSSFMSPVDLHNIHIIKKEVSNAVR
ncbi:MAG: hypothetical protein EOP53_16045 [Sphingobacteriales bacterium]|nr:MAG: hypothetical protein EOP53_16045 [Sphingobacteriales bacterium]